MIRISIIKSLFIKYILHRHDSRCRNYTYFLLTRTQRLFQSSLISPPQPMITMIHLLRTFQKMNFMHMMRNEMDRGHMERKQIILK